MKLKNNSEFLTIRVYGFGLFSYAHLMRVNMIDFFIGALIDMQTQFMLLSSRLPHIEQPQKSHHLFHWIRGNRHEKTAY